MKIASVVIVYNSKLTNSDTLTSLLACKKEKIDLTILVWNNGPNFLSEEDINTFLISCKEKGINAKIYQDIRNISLSKVYNFFIEREEFDFLTLLDQDSTLPEGYYTNISMHLSEDIITPIIIAEKDGILAQTDPHFYGDVNLVIPEGKVNIKIDSVMSGLAISRKGINKIKNYRNYVFEERLAFYGIDSDLFRTINIMQEAGCPLEIYCTNEIHHSFAMFNSEEQKSSFRVMEMFYFQSFIRNEYQKKSKLSTLFIYLRDFLRRKVKFEVAKNLIIFSMDSTHPRSKINIEKDITATNSYIIKTKK
ncbi:hypothetical protein KU74_16880 [Pectobacterium brasiliense]|uniref:Glycosyltransferase n=1 Tax=Pectobacterium brasiliense TaxID=180957 RepID=A0A0M2F0G3_9GAMM|nr:hypothetical protein [Pectobacterium brasiliense]KGA32820.1 hypothetical protein KU74_16880 [Pectobacterium brasiliense]